MVDTPLEQLHGEDPELVQRTLDSLDDPIFVKDRQHRWIVMNEAFCKLLARPREQLLGKSDPDFFPQAQAEAFWRHDDELFESGASHEKEELLTDKDGLEHTIWTRKYPMRDADGQVVGLVGIISDITALRGRLDAINELEQQTRAQQALIDAMAVPLIAVWEGILLVPLVGEVSAARATRVLEELLRSVAAEGTKLVFLDISGVPTLSAERASKLVETIAATRLLGAQAEIVGVSAEIARQLVTQGVELGVVRTHASLREGLRQALVRLG